MKKYVLLLEILAVSIFLIIPPLTAKAGSPSADITKISTSILIELCIAFLLELQYREAFKIKKNEIYLKKLVKNLKWNAISLSSLMFIYAALETVQIFFIKTPQIQNKSMLAKSFSEWIFLILNLAASAFFEEEIYRQFLPNSLIFLTDFSNSAKKQKVLQKQQEISGNKEFLNEENPQKLSAVCEKKSFFYKARIFLIESACILIFAFSHHHNGIFSVINAFFCGIILRLSCIKTQSVFPGMAAHFSYNTILVLFNYFMNF